MSARPVVEETPRFGMPPVRHVPGTVPTRLVSLPGRSLGSARVIIDAGALWEDPTRGGVAALLADAFTEGSDSRTGDELAEALEGLGARVQAWGSWDSIGIGVGAPVEFLAEALALVAEAVPRPALPADALARLRAERESHLRQLEAQPPAKSRLAFSEALFGTQAYGRDALGRLDSVAGLDADAVAEHHRAWVTPGATTLIVAGDLDGIDGSVFSAAFDGWSAVEAARDLTPPSAVAAPTGIRLIDRPGAVQSAIALGHASVPRASEDYAPLSMVVDALGGLFDSRLNMELRERRGYTYGVGGALDANRLAGSIVFGGTVETKHTAAAIEVFIDEIRRMRDAGPTQEEVERVRRHVDGSFPLRNQTASQLAALVGTQVVHDLPDDYWDRLADVRAGLTADDLAGAAARALDPDGLRVVVVGDAAVTGDDLRALGLAVDVVDA